MPGKSSLIVLVGHCGPDTFALTRFVRDAAPDARIECAASDRELEKRLDEAQLLLINRELNGHFRKALGVELIRELRLRGASPQMMLVSNFADAQSSAIEAGALPGFGKRELHDPGASERLRNAIQANGDGA